ncbi:FecR domain-containing protein [Caulobacter segnis]|uniref:Iron dicitrate transport regulator FecR n=1 Tax=Caulobacter segnis TaxID=88688 RepID=A0A2W5VDQ5_9CAUL|nr:FecR domain-containing protein [Caulobacter segnis]PZR36647.1 MAG: iron dicitrate transport regulator FecR [Caulobacter segnis]
MIADQRKTDRQDKEAAAWFTLLSDTEVENEDLEKFDAWLQRGDNRAAYHRIEEISELGRTLRDDPDLRAAAREALHRPRRVPAPRRTPWLRIGGGLALTGGLACATALLWAGPIKTFQTDVGQRDTVRLEDGSAVELNTDTTLRVRFSRGARRLELVKGQAFFDVAHDTARPFLVKAGQMEVRAVGTRFDVRHDGPGATVALAQGRVKVRQQDAGKTDWTLSPGQALALAPGATGAQPKAIDLAVQTGWLKNEIIFHDVALADAVKEMNRYERAKITLAPGVPAQSRVNGVFTPGEEEEFVAAVATSFGLQSRRRADGGMELQPRSGA